MLVLEYKVINILNRGIATVGQTGCKAAGLATSTLLGENLVEQVTRVKAESHGFS